MKLSAEIRKIRIKRSQIEVNWENEEAMTLKIACEASIAEPKEKEDRSALVTITLFADDENENFKAELEAEIVFEFNETPEEYGKEVMGECVPIAAKALLVKLDDMLIQMDERKLGLADII